MATPVHVIVLNGVSSAGKSSLAKALQRITVEPFLHLQMDAFLDMLPGRTMNHPDGITFERIEADQPTVAIWSGWIVETALSGMRHAVAALAAQGNNVIVDDVMFDGREEADYRRLLAPFDFKMVGVKAPLEIIEARERARGDRDVGLARWQFDRVHAGRVYDLEIHTADISPEQGAELIKDAFGL